MFMYLLVYLGYGYSFDVDKKELTVFFDTSMSFYLDNSLRYTTLKVNEINSFIKLSLETLNISILNILILDGKMIKRPLVIVNDEEENNNKNILLGFKEEEYKNIF